MGWLVEQGYAQVKTGGYSPGPGRWQVAVCTRGGNQSWNGVVKRFSPDRCDDLFVLTADGRRWFIPSDQVGGRNAIVVGSPKYTRFEVSRGRGFA